MPRIDVPAGRDPLLHLWGGTGNKLAGPAAAFSDAVYRKSTLPLREFEAARITIARVNDCRICLDLRPEDGPGQAFYDAVLGDGADPAGADPAGADPAGADPAGADPAGADLDGAALTEREALAAEFARRFALDHLGMDDALWERLHAAFTDDELVQLGLCVGSWLAFGRFNRVFGVDEACRIPLAPHGPGSSSRRPAGVNG